jgi:beta-galactosidase
MKSSFLPPAFFLFVLLATSHSFSQTKPAFASGTMDTVLYGAAYYTEYMPHERLEQDVQLMQQAGINVVRMGESSWGLWEPQDGHFEFAWMDRVIDRMQKAGIKVILGTPTYSIPAWMYKEHPEIVITRFGGQTITFGYRQQSLTLKPWDLVIIEER